MIKRQLYDLAAADDNLRFSPYCWRAKLALAHKNLAYDSIPWRFTDKDEIAFSGQNLVPVLVDGAAIISDSQRIAEYLETTYTNEPPLFGDAAATALTMFVKTWTEDVLHPAIARFIMPDILPQLHPKDQPYFRRSREARIGKTIEALGTERPTHLAAFNALLPPLRATLQAQPFLAGPGPAYADHIVFGALQWAKLMSATPLLTPADPIHAWMHALLATYGMDLNP